MLCLCVFVEIYVSTNNLFVKQKIIKIEWREGQMWWIQIDPLYIVVSISIKIVIPFLAVPNVGICMIDDIVSKVIATPVRV